MIAGALWILFLILLAASFFWSFYLFRYTLDVQSNGDGLIHRTQVPDLATLPLSIIICAKNEALNLAANLPKVLAQQYHYADGSPAFEVIVVDDDSEDESAEILSDFATQHAHLKIVRSGRDAAMKNGATAVLARLRGKKFPLSCGVSAARYDNIVCTDSDCMPASEAWLHFMAAPFAAGKELVAGYGGYLSRPGLLNAWIRFETIHTFIQYFSAARWGSGYMAVGRNLAATKAAFLKAQAHRLWAQIPSGDDDMLVQICATPANMAVVAHPASFTWSEPKAGVREYLAQKRRHVSTGKYYAPGTQILLAGYAGLHTCWWAGIITAIACSEVYIAILLLALPVIFCSFLSDASRQLRHSANAFQWLLFSFCWLLYNAVLAPYILWKNKHRWQ